MDQPDSPDDGGRSNRKELQGPRPTPLKVRKESHKIKKPPVGPSHNQQQPPPQPPRQPVIIYTVSPKVIHTHPSDFMTLVQRLTGPDATSSSSSSLQYNHHPPSFSITTSSSSNNVGGGGYSSSTTSHNNKMAHHHHVSGAISPAARFASIEKTKKHSEDKKFVGPTSEVREGNQIHFMAVDHYIANSDDGGGGAGGGDDDDVHKDQVERTMVFPGILSPGPGSLPPISPNLFSPFFQNDSNNLINLHQHQANKSSIEGSYLPSPFSTNLFTPSPMFSPSSLDFLQRVWDS